MVFYPRWERTERVIRCQTFGLFDLLKSSNYVFQNCFSFTNLVFMFPKWKLLLVTWNQGSSSPVYYLVILVDIFE